MDAASVITILSLIGMAAGIWSLSRLPGKKREYESLRQHAMACFKGINVPSPHRGLRFSGASAEVIKTEAVGIDRSTFGLTIYARNEAGEYFMFKAGPDKHWIKHMDTSTAKAVLKNLYLPPPLRHPTYPEDSTG